MCVWALVFVQKARRVGELFHNGHLFSKIFNTIPLSNIKKKTHLGDNDTRLVANYCSFCTMSYTMNSAVDICPASFEPLFLSLFRKLLFLLNAASTG